MKLSLKNLLQNKIVLYVVLFLSITSMFSYLMAQNYAPVLFFIAVAFLTNNFSKNMIVVLGIALISTNLLTSTSNIFSHRGLREGFKEGNKNNDDDNNNDDNNNDDNYNNNNSDNNDNNDNDNDNYDEKIDQAKRAKKELRDLEDETPKIQCKGISKEECKRYKNDCEWNNNMNKCNQMVKNKSNFQNLNPASYPNPNKSKPNLDEAGTIEAAYDNLENIMGSDSIRSMTADTQKLADRQKELVDQLKNIAPLIGQTTKMISTFNMDGKLQGMIDGLTKNISQLDTSVPQGVKDPTN